MAQDTTLIFPCSVPDGELYAEAAKQRGEKVVAASSFLYDPSAEKFEKWFYLPSVHDENFAPRLNQAIAEFQIARVYCPVLSAYDVLNTLISEGKLSIQVIGEIPMRRFLSGHRELMETAAILHDLTGDISERRSNLTILDVASVLRQSLGIFGESDKYKIAAMMAIFADAPAGDLVEIGVLAGRSACVLAMMSQHHGTGAVLAVDTWSSFGAKQHDSAKNFRRMFERWSPGLPIENFFEPFLISLLPIAATGRFNYLMVDSKEAHKKWLRDGQVRTPEFGLTEYRRSISVLHIDANHDYERVQEDCALWLPHLVAGGWLILDDYVWLHGDGPRRVGDALLIERSAQIRHAFVCGKALFIKFGD